jgi:hypothetical protein
MGGVKTLPVSCTMRVSRLSRMRAACNGRARLRRGQQLAPAGRLPRSRLLGLVALAVTALTPDAAAATKATVIHRTSAHESAEAGRWAFAIALFVLVFVLPLSAWCFRWAWWVLWGKRKQAQQPALFWGRSLFVGQDNRVSTSKTTALVWTYTLAAAVASFVIAQWWGHGGALSNFSKQGVDAQFALLIGGPLGAAILAKGIVSSQVASGDQAKPPADSPSPAQLVQNDTGQADLGDLQYLLFNLVALLFFYGELLRSPQHGLPTIPDALVGLTSVAAVAYVGKKTLSGPAVIGDVLPPFASVGDPVRLVTAGIVESGDDLSLVNVAFGAASAQFVGPITTTATQGVLLEVSVPPSAAGKVNISASVSGGRSATWPGFKVVPTIPDGQNLAGQPGQEILMITTGVADLGPKLFGVVATIDDRSASVRVDPADLDGNTLLVTIRNDIPIPNGEPNLLTHLVIKTPGGESAPASLNVTRA